MLTTQNRKRVGIVGLFHESNTFIPEKTNLEKFTIFSGAEIRETFASAYQEIGGYFQVLDEAGFEAVPIFYATAVPWGKVDDHALATLWSRMEEGVRAAGHLDGILAAPHGAAVNETHDDMDGWWLTRLRALTGGIPIIATMDPHTNLTPAMVSACEALIAYRQNPHLDQRQRGEEAATLMVRTLRGEIHPTSAGTYPAFAINIERQLTFAEPMQSLIRELDAVRALPGVLSASVTMGFPYADVPEMGTAFVVVTDAQPELAQSLCDRLAAWLNAHGELFRGQMISPDEALALIPSSAKPVGLLDMGDNTGGGAPGDSTVLARMCAKAGSWKTIFYLPDPESVQAAVEAGIGNTVRLQVGGKLAMSPEAPLEVEAVVEGIYDGHFTDTKPRHGGRSKGYIGTSAVVRTAGNMTILLARIRTGVSGSAEPLRACGIHLEDFDVIIIKGVHAPVGAYAEICPTLIRVNTPGVTTADMDKLQFHRRRRPLFPLD